MAALVTISSSLRGGVVVASGGAAGKRVDDATDLLGQLVVVIRHRNLVV